MQLKRGRKGVGASAADKYINLSVEFALDKPLRFGYNEYIPKNTVVNVKKVIAGAGSNEVLRAADRLSNNYGGNPLDWSKVVGTIDSLKYTFDIHWYYHNTIGSKEFKVKNYKERDDKK